MIKRTANELSPGYLLISAAIISFLVLLTIKKIQGNPQNT
jgi:hypothetical protein